MILVEVIFYAILTIHVIEIAFCQNNPTWRMTVASKGILDAANLTRKSFPCLSDIVCAMAASRTSWANLLCYEGGICSVLSYMAVPYGSSSEISDPVTCMTKLDGCIFNETYYQIGDMDIVDNAPVCRNRVCQKNGLMAPLPLDVKLSGSCDPPFTLYNPYGCFFNPIKAMNFCSGFDYCQSIGGTLWTFEENQTAIFINAAFAELGAWSYDFFLGIFNSGSEYMWIDGATVVNMTTDSWDPISSSLPPTNLCVRTSRTWNAIYYIVPISCSASMPILCQKKFNP